MKKREARPYFLINRCLENILKATGAWLYCIVSRTAVTVLHNRKGNSLCDSGSCVYLAGYISDLSLIL